MFALGRESTAVIRYLNYRSNTNVLMFLLAVGFLKTTVVKKTKNTTVIAIIKNKGKKYKMTYYHLEHVHYHFKFGMGNGSTHKLHIAMKASQTCL